MSLVPVHLVCGTEHMRCILRDDREHEEQVTRPLGPGVHVTLRPDHGQMPPTVEQDWVIADAFPPVSDLEIHGGFFDPPGAAVLRRDRQRLPHT